RKCNKEAGVDAEPDRRHERLADRERRELPVPRRKDELQGVDQAPVEDERDDEAEEQRADAREQPLAQLLEVLDERRLLAVSEAARRADAHRVLVDGLVLAGGLDRRVRPGAELGRFRLRIAGDRVLELTHARAERPSDLREPLRAEEQKGDE